MTLLAQVVARLEGHGIACALIGAEALAVRGVSRATVDRDLLTTDLRALEQGTWAILVDAGVEADIRTGEPDDPLAGVVRFKAAGERPVDLVVGRHRWQSNLVQRCEVLNLGEVNVAVASAADLILLKLYGGGPQDAWDIHQLLADESRTARIAEVDSRLADLPDASRKFWRRILES